MTENTIINHVPDRLSHARVFELLPGAEFMVFFAASEDELPNDTVRRELRVLAIHDRAEQKRSVLGTLATDIIAGAVGGAAWDAIKGTFAALAEYLRHKHGTPSVDAETIIKRLAIASEKILGPEPPGPENLKIRQLEDHRWETQFTRGGTAVRATLDPGGTIVKWSQNTGK